MTQLQRMTSSNILRKWIRIKIDMWSIAVKLKFIHHIWCNLLNSDGVSDWRKKSINSCLWCAIRINILDSINISFSHILYNFLHELSALMMMMCAGCRFSFWIFPTKTCFIFQFICTRASTVKSHLNSNTFAPHQTIRTSCMLHEHAHKTICNIYVERFLPNEIIHIWLVIWSNEGITSRANRH